MSGRRPLRKKKRVNERHGVNKLEPQGEHPSLSAAEAYRRLAEGQASADDLIVLQRTCGNQSVTQLLNDNAHAPEGPARADPSILQKQPVRPPPTEQERRAALTQTWTEDVMKLLADSYLQRTDPRPISPRTAGRTVAEMDRLLPRNWVTGRRYLFRETLRSRFRRNKEKVQWYQTYLDRHMQGFPDRPRKQIQGLLKEVLVEGYQWSPHDRVTEGIRRLLSDFQAFASGPIQGLCFDADKGGSQYYMMYRNALGTYAKTILSLIKAERGRFPGIQVPQGFTPQQLRDYFRYRPDVEGNELAYTAWYDRVLQEVHRSALRSTLPGRHNNQYYLARAAFLDEIQRQLTRVGWFDVIRDPRNDLRQWLNTIR